jgi:hypothetical protein
MGAPIQRLWPAHLNFRHQFFVSLSWVQHELRRPRA